MDTSLGERIREQRTARGMTQEELAHRAGIATRTLSRIESGEPRSGDTDEPRRPQRSTLRMIALALGVDYEWLLSGLSATGTDAA